MLATEPFADLTANAARGFGLPETRFAVVPHPLGATDPEQVRRWADAAVDGILALLTQRSD